MRRLLAALAATIALGLVSRLCPIGWPAYDKSLGDVLYAVAVYLVLAILLNRRVAIVAAVALVVCLAIEVFKLTGVPAEYGHLTAIRWTLGTTFSWHNLACYAVGVALVALLDRKRPVQRAL
jgi:hypothetical protein